MELFETPSANSASMSGAVHPPANWTTLSAAPGTPPAGRDWPLARPAGSAARLRQPMRSRCSRLTTTGGTTWPIAQPRIRGRQRRAINAHMRAWSKSLEAMVRAEPQRLIAENGERALEIARGAARRARDQHNHKLARQYALVAAYIAKQRKPTQQAMQDANY